MRQQALLRFCISVFLLSPLYSGKAQGVERFSVEDFDLQGAVQQCVVLTAYGREEFNFNRQGLLTKVLIRYNENDLDVTHYRYQDSLLREKRDEVYRDGAFDAATSLAHFYTRDTLREKDSILTYVLKERILSYDKELNELNEFYYDGEGRLERSVHSTAEGIDDFQIQYQQRGDTLMKIMHRNEALNQLEKHYPRISESGDTLRYKVFTEYLSDLPEKKTREVRNTAGRLVEKKTWSYAPNEQAFRLEETIRYTYNEQGFLQEELLVTGKSRKKKEYVYQYDNDGKGNWVKQIVLPDNAYVTRKISYFDRESPQALKGNPKE